MCVRWRTPAGNEIADEAANEVLGEVGTEVGTELGMMLFDTVLPGASLIRWGFKLAAMAINSGTAGPQHSDRLTLSSPDTMCVVQWLLHRGCHVVLQDRGMSEMMVMIASSEYRHAACVDGLWAALPQWWRNLAEALVLCYFLKQCNRRPDSWPSCPAP